MSIPQAMPWARRCALAYCVFAPPRTFPSSSAIVSGNVSESTSRLHSLSAWSVSIEGFERVYTSQAAEVADETQSEGQRGRNSIDADLYRRYQSTLVHVHRLVVDRHPIVVSQRTLLPSTGITDLTWSRTKRVVHSEGYLNLPSLSSVSSCLLSIISPSLPSSPPLPRPPQPLPSRGTHTLFSLGISSS